MRIIIKCSECGKELNTKEIYPDHENNTIVKVEPCGNIDCNNCEGCEEAENVLKLQKEQKELKANLTELIGKKPPK